MNLTDSHQTPGGSLCQGYNLDQEREKVHKRILHESPQTSTHFLSKTFPHSISSTFSLLQTPDEPPYNETNGSGFFTKLGSTDCSILEVEKAT